MDTKKGRRLLFILGLAAVINFSMTARGENVPVVYTEPLLSALQATGAEAEKIQWRGWMKLSGASPNAAEMEKMARTAMRTLNGGDDAYELTERRVGRRYIVQARWRRDGAQVSVGLRRLDGYGPAADGIYFICNMDEDFCDEAQMKAGRERLARAFRNFAGEAQITTCLSGYLDGKLGKDEWDARLQDAFAAVGARVSGAAAGGNYLSYTGCTPLIQERLRAGGEVVNLHMAMRYNAVADRTQVLIATPIIACDY